jgi:hypothetical protein
MLELCGVFEFWKHVHEIKFTTTSLLQSRCARAGLHRYVHVAPVTASGVRSPGRLRGGPHNPRGFCTPQSRTPCPGARERGLSTGPLGTRWRVPHREAPWRMQAEPAGLRRRAYSYCSKAAYDAHVSSSIQSKPQQLPVLPPLLYSVRRQHHCRKAAKPPPCASQHHSAAPPLSLLLHDTAKPPPNSPNAPSLVTGRSSGRLGCTTLQAAGATLSSPTKTTCPLKKVSSSPGWAPPAKSGCRRPWIPAGGAGSPPGDHIARFEFFAGSFPQSRGCSVNLKRKFKGPPVNGLLGFQLNLWKIIKNRIKIIKMLIQFCWVPGKETYLF